jgi:hypothetical protein
VAGDPHADWLGRFTLDHGEWPLWLMGLGPVVAGFSTRGLRVRCGRDPFRIAYLHLAELTFQTEATQVRLRREGEPQRSYVWPVSAQELGQEPVDGLVTLLNQAAGAARQGLAELDAGRQFFLLPPPRFERD